MSDRIGGFIIAALIFVIWMLAANAIAQKFFMTFEKDDTSRRFAYRLIVKAIFILPFALIALYMRIG